MKRVLVFASVFLIMVSYFADYKMLCLLARGICVIPGLYFFYNLKLKELIKIWSLAFPILSLFEYCVGIAFYDYDFYIGKWVTLFIIIASLIFCFFTIRKKINSTVFLSAGKLLIFISLELFALFFMIVVITYPGKGSMELWRVAVVICGGVSFVVSSIFMLYVYSKKQKYKIEAEYLEKLATQQKEYFEHLLDKEEETRKFRHDITSELIQLQNFVEKKDIKAFNSYISEMQNEIKNISKATYTVGNSIMDTILNFYLVPIKNNCKIEVKGILGKQLMISERDFCIVISNLIKNAVEAVSTVDAKNRFINVEVSQGESNLAVKIENSFSGEITISKNGIPITFKKDKKNHGIGIKNIIKTIKNNGGEYFFEIEKNKYISYIRMKNNNLATVCQ